MLELIASHQNTSLQPTPSPSSGTWARSSRPTRRGRPKSSASSRTPSPSSPTSSGLSPSSSCWCWRLRLASASPPHWHFPPGLRRRTLFLVLPRASAPTSRDTRRSTCSTVRNICRDARLFLLPHLNINHVYAGPPMDYLVAMGAKFSPCMRKDTQVFVNFAKQADAERNLGCCIRGGDKACGMTSRDYCTGTVMGTFTGVRGDAANLGGGGSDVVCLSDTQTLAGKTKLPTVSRRNAAPVLYVCAQ